MKPSEKKPEIVYRIISRKTGNPVGSFSRTCDQFNFASPAEARSANVHGVFQNEKAYAIAKYRITYELLEEDVR